MTRWLLGAAVLAACSSSPALPADAGSVDAAFDAASNDAGAEDAGLPERTLVRERFDEMPTGVPPSLPWVTEGSVTVREVPFAANKSVELTKGSGAGTASLAADFTERHGRVVFEATVLSGETAGFKAVPYIYDAAGAALASISFQDGSIQAHVGDTTTTVQAFTAGAWYRIRLVVDTAAGDFDLFVDGVRKLVHQPLRAAAGGVARVRWYLDGSAAGTLLVDDVIVYVESDYIGAPPAPVFDVRDFGAVGDGSTSDQSAIQRAIDAAAGTGGSVLLAGGTFLSGTITLRGGMTFYVAPSATLRGSTAAADYPMQSPSTGNTQLSNCRRALLYAPQVAALRIDGGGVIDGQGGAFPGAESARPIVIWSVLSRDVAIRNLHLMNGAVWSLVSMESDQVVIENLDVESAGITHDGIDIVDGSDITVRDVAVRSGDDALCLKSGVRRGIDGLRVQHSVFGGSNGGSNGIKFGTASYGAFRHVAIEDDYVKDVQYAAMAVESRQGADVADVAFRRIGFANTGAAFFVYLAEQSTAHPDGDVPKLGSISDLSFVDVAGVTGSWPHSPHQGSLITGHLYGGVTYPIRNLEFTRVVVQFDGGLTVIPASPPEATPDQYPESNMFGDLPAWGYYLRHVSGARFDGCSATVAGTDARQKLVAEDVTGLVGSP
jgi:hypothetical protein